MEKLELHKETQVSFSFEQCSGLLRDGAWLYAVNIDLIPFMDT